MNDILSEISKQANTNVNYSLVRKANPTKILTVTEFTEIYHGIFFSVSRNLTKSNLSSKIDLRLSLNFEMHHH